MVVMKPKACFNNNKIKGNEEPIMVISNCTLLHNQIDGWTVPNLYFSACHKYVYKTLLLIYTEILILNLITDFMNLSNQMFLFINCSLWVVFSLFRKFSWVARPEIGPMWPISPPLWYNCYRQTDYMQNMHGLTKFLFVEVSCLRIQNEN
jgi:hypothetical protein